MSILPFFDAEPLSHYTAALKMNLSDEDQLQLFNDRRRCLRAEPSDGSAPTIIVSVPLEESDSSSTTSEYRELNLGRITDVVEIIFDAEAESSSLIDSATYCIIISDADMDKLSPTQCEFFGFNL